MPLMSDNLRSAASALTIFALVIVGLVFGKEIILPFAIAAILSFILSPIVRRLSRTFIPHSLAVGLVMIVFIGAVAVSSTLLTNQILSLATDLGTHRGNILEKVRSVRGVGQSDGVIKKAAESIDSLGDAIRAELAEQATTGPAGVPPPAIANERQPPRVVVNSKEPKDVWDEYVEPIKPIAAPMATLALTMLFTLFLLLQHADLRDRVVRVAGTNNMTGTIAAMSEAGSRLSQLFLMQALLNIGFGVFVTLALTVLGVPNAVLCGVVAAIMRFVPYIGSVLAAIVPLMLAAAVDPGWTTVIATALVFIIGEPLMGHVIEPFVLGKRVGLSPLAMVLAASFWTIVWGPVGLILAAPLTMTLVVLGRYISGLEFFTVLLGDEPALSPHEAFYHRILARDAAGAMDQIETAMDQASAAQVSDQIVLPALNLAAVDHRWGRLDREGTEEFKETFATFREMAEDVFETPPHDEDGEPTVLIVPARGEIDISAASYLATVLEAKSCATEVVTGASGLTALSDAKARAGKLDTIIVATVGGVEHQHMKFITRRTKRDFPDAKLVVFEWGRNLEDGVRSDDVIEGTVCTSTEALLAGVTCGKSGDTQSRPKSTAASDKLKIAV